MPEKSEGMDLALCRCRDEAVKQNLAKRVAAENSMRGLCSEHRRKLTCRVEVDEWGERQANRHLAHSPNGASPPT